VSLPGRTTIRLSVYTPDGQCIRTLASGRREAGRFSLIWDGASENGGKVAAGIYVCRLVAGNRVFSQKMILSK
jgi:flagellar hook assembly protein FlgD